MAARPKVNVLTRAMRRSFSLLLLIVGGALTCLRAEDSFAGNADTKKAHPPQPEQAGLQLEVNANLEDVLTSEGVVTKWELALLQVEIALKNTSPHPLNVATTAYQGGPTFVPWPGWGEGIERVMFLIESPTFQGQPTVYNPDRFGPVVLAPGERVLLLKSLTQIPDRKHADAIKEVSVHYGVTRNFVGPKDWWRGQLETYAPIHRGKDPEQRIAEEKAALIRYQAEMAAEQIPGYGQRNAARVAALVAQAEQASIRGELAPEKDAVIIRDAGWIKRVSETIAAATLPHSDHVFSLGHRTAYFYRDGQLLVSIAAIGENQVRVRWPEGGGDYAVDGESYRAMERALALPPAKN